MFAQLTGLEALDQQLAGLPEDMLARLEDKARALAAALAAKVRDDKLSGQALETKTGALKSSIVADVTVGDGALTATVGSDGSVKYAAIQEYGGRTPAHEILPDKAKALAFLGGGGMRFARRVQHPGSTLPARAYLQSSLDEFSDEIVAELSSVVGETWGQT
jgi:phage gpG-like protein